MHPTQESSRLQKLLSDAAAKHEHFAAEFDKVQHQTIIDQQTFFNRLSIFNTGAIAATITFAGILRQHQAQSEWRWILFSGWIALIVSSALAFWRNWAISSHVYYQAAASYFESHGKFFIANREFFAKNPGAIQDQNTGSVMDRKATIERLDIGITNKKSDADDHQVLSDKHLSTRKYCERFSLIFSLLGIALVMAFAMRNFR